MRWLLAAAPLAALVATTTHLHAEPQANIAATFGVAGVGSSGDVWSQTRLHLGGRGDVLFGRSRNLDWGFGPYGEVQTAFNDLSTGGGLSVLAPVHSYLPIVLSGGAYARRNPGDEWKPGLTGQVFWGSRSYNYGSWYVMAGGLTLQARVGLGSDKERAFIVAAHLDGEVLMLPFLFLYEAVSGPSGE